MEFLQIILTPFSWLLETFHNVFGNYGIALILFAIVVKAILFPFSLKGKRGMIQMNLIQGKVQKIQKQYANNKQKMNEEVQALYAREKVSPMNGCLWSFIPLLILWPLYAIIRRPLHYMMGLGAEAILAISKVLGFTSGTAEMTVSNISSGYNELKMAGMMTADNLTAVKNAAEAAASGSADQIFHINFNFLGLDLSTIPQWKFWEVGSPTWAYIGLFLLPLISAGLGLVMSIVSQKTNNMGGQANAQAGKQMRTMMYFMPLISLWIGFAMPAALCIYWIINNLLSIVQEIACGKILKKDYEKAALAKAEQERLEKEEEKRKKQEAAERKAKAMEAAKQNKGKKKPAKVISDPQKSHNSEASRVGMRSYARGRAYDPERYGGVTVYRDPGVPIDEEAVEQARVARELQEEEAQQERRALEMEQDELDDASAPELGEAHSELTEDHSTGETLEQSAEESSEEEEEYEESEEEEETEE